MYFLNFYDLLDVHFPQYKIPNPFDFNIGNIYSETVEGLLTALAVAILKLFLNEDCRARFSIRSFITNILFLKLMLLIISFSESDFF